MKTYKSGTGNDTHDLYYIFGWSLSDILDTDKWSVPKPKKKKWSYGKKESDTQFNIKVSKNIEFIGSLAEYVSSLPDVDDDWYQDAMLKFQLPKVDF